jgi:hypothetical protein
VQSCLQLSLGNEPTFAQARRWVRTGGEAYLLVLKGCTIVQLVQVIPLRLWWIGLLAEFADVFGDPPSLPPVRNVAHVAPLIPGSRPPYRKNDRMTETEKIELKQQLTELRTKGLINPSVSPSFGSPVLLVKKSNGELRLVCDYRVVNRITVGNRYPFYPELMTSWINCLVLSASAPLIARLDIIRSA